MMWVLASLLVVSFGADPMDPVRSTWLHLPETMNHCRSGADAFPGGDLRTLYCHAREDLPLRQVAALAGVPIWVSGPHDVEGGPDLDNAGDFGHYNPAFVVRFGELALPAASDSAFRAASQGTYDTILRSRARAAWGACRRLETHMAVTQKLIGLYQGNTKVSAPLRRNWSELLPGSGEVVPSSTVSWWLRRHMDGTSEEWGAVLQRTLELYDADWLGENPPVARSLAPGWSGSIDMKVALRGR